MVVHCYLKNTLNIFKTGGILWTEYNGIKIHLSENFTSFQYSVEITNRDIHMLSGL